MGDELRLLAGSDVGLFDLRSRDGGETWERPEPLLSDMEVSAIAQAPDGSVYVGTRFKGMFHSPDGLDGWEHIETPAGLEHVRSFNIAPDRFLAGNEAGAEPVGVFEWEDKKRWRRLGDMTATCSGSAEWFYPVATEGVHIRHLTRDPHKPDRIYAAMQVGGVAISPDGGESWYDRTNLDCDVHMVQANPAEPGVVYAGSGGGGLYRSADWGENWECVSEGCGHFVVQFAIDPKDPRRLYLGTAQGGVRSWRENPEIGARGQVFRSDDGGDSWRKLGGGLPELMRSRVNAMVVDPEDPRNVFFTGGHTKGLPESGVHYSGDYGETWRSIADIDEVIALCRVRA